MKKTWHQKLESGTAKVVVIPDHWAKTIGPGTMVILTPAIIDAFVRTIPLGKLTTVNQIRETFARQYHTHTTCPLTTGIFLRIVAGAAEDDRASERTQISPYWRVLKEGGRLNPKYPGGVTHQAELLRKEGFEIVEGKSMNAWKVKNYLNSMIAT